VGQILTVNAGSTSLKLRLVDPDGGGRALAGLDDVPAGVAGVGHRVVHGGARLRVPVQVDAAVVAGIEEAAALAPLHDAPALAALDEARRALPDVPHVAVFDTAFHAGMPAEASTYAVPRRWREELGIRRYGSHGISVVWAVARAGALTGRDPTGLRIVVCHLGGGASATAVRGGRSVDTTMGFGPLDGLVMATRSGALDPDVPLHLVLRRGMDPAEVERLLNQESGLTALAGTPDMREVETAAAGGDPAATEALAVYDHRLAASVGALTAALGGLDVLVFTGGIGEGSPRVRAAAGARLGHLGVGRDAARNRAATGDADLSAAGAPVTTLVVRAREDLVIARAVRRIIESDEGDGT
jgi:acetate kinase